MPLPLNNESIFLIGNADRAQKFFVSIDVRLQCIASSLNTDAITLQVIYNPENTYSFRCINDDRNFGLYMTAIPGNLFDTGVYFGGTDFRWTLILDPLDDTFSISMNDNSQFLTLMQPPADLQLKALAKGSGKSQKWKFRSV